MEATTAVWRRGPLDRGTDTEHLAIKHKVTPGKPTVAKTIFAHFDIDNAVKRFCCRSYEPGAVLLACV
jgi:hypothetical protein